MKIVIALDTSEHSEHALEFVTRMRWPAGSRVIVVSALQSVATALVAGVEAGLASGDLLQVQQKQLEGLVSQAESTLRESGFPTEGRVLLGDPREVLIDLARNERADLIVVGSRGRTGVAKLMLGSVSSHIVTHAPCSVLVVKRPGASDHHPSPRKEPRS